MSSGTLMLSESAFCSLNRPRDHLQIHQEFMALFPYSSGYDAKAKRTLAGRLSPRLSCQRSGTFFLAAHLVFQFVWLIVSGRWKHALNQRIIQTIFYLLGSSSPCLLFCNLVHSSPTSLLLYLNIICLEISLVFAALLCFLCLCRIFCAFPDCLYFCQFQFTFPTSVHSSRPWHGESHALLILSSFRPSLAQPCTAYHIQSCETFMQRFQSILKTGSFHLSTFWRGDSKEKLRFANKILRLRHSYSIACVYSL